MPLTNPTAASPSRASSRWCSGSAVNRSTASALSSWSNRWAARARSAAVSAREITMSCPGDTRDGLEHVCDLADRPARIDLGRRAGPEERLDRVQVVEDERALRVGLAVVVRPARCDTRQENLLRGAQQHHGLESRVEPTLVRDTSRDEQRAVGVSVEQRVDPILAPKR